MAIIITDEDARRHLDMKECIDAMRVCFQDFADQTAISLPRVRYTIENGDKEKSYYANVHVGAAPSFGLACVRAGTHIIDDNAYDSGRRSMRNPEPVNWTVVILYDIKTSEPVAFMHESHVSGIRVGATTGAAVNEIAREDASILGLLGTGRQSRAHAEAISAVRKIEKIKLFSPNTDHVRNWIHDMQHLDAEIIPVSDARTVVEGSDIVCCATNTTTPVLRGEWLCNGQMVVSIVNSDPTATRREVDNETFIRASDIVINDWDSVYSNKQIELIEPLEAGLVKKENVHVLGEIFAGRAQVKSAPDNIIYYKNNTGLAMQFAAAGALIQSKMAEGDNTNRIIPREWLAADQYGIG
ncbi:MAG: hypothetical protein VYE62_12165 [Pseudomonadota bacterium]|nr:hypothetical protein [Pseudomonadota bacterium]MEC9208708.1 hypothetical protein [Pseudomonadota bacterium]